MTAIATFSSAIDADVSLPAGETGKRSVQVIGVACALAGMAVATANSTSERMAANSLMAISPGRKPDWTAGIAPVPRSSGGPNESGLGHCFPDHDEIRAKRTDFNAVWQASLRQKAYLTDGRDDRAHPAAVSFTRNAAAGRHVDRLEWRPS